MKLEANWGPEGPGTPRRTSRERLGQAAGVVMAGLSSAVSAIGPAPADPSQTAVGKLDVGLATWRTLVDAWAVENAGGPGVRQEVLRDAGLTRPPWAQGGPWHGLQSPGPPPEKASLVFLEHDLPVGALVQAAMLGETMPVELELALDVDRPVHLDLQLSRRDSGSQPVQGEDPEDSGP